jgi:hypothetical protein
VRAPRIARPQLREDRFPLPEAQDLVLLFDEVDLQVNGFEQAHAAVLIAPVRY